MRVVTTLDPFLAWGIPFVCWSKYVAPSMKNAHPGVLAESGQEAMLTMNYITKKDRFWDINGAEEKPPPSPPKTVPKVVSKQSVPYLACTDEF